MAFVFHGRSVWIERGYKALGGFARKAMFVHDHGR